MEIILISDIMNLLESYCQEFGITLPYEIPNIMQKRVVYFLTVRYETFIINFIKNIIEDKNIPSVVIDVAFDQVQELSQIQANFLIEFYKINHTMAPSTKHLLKISESIGKGTINLAGISHLLTKKNKGYRKLLFLLRTAHISIVVKLIPFFNSFTHYTCWHDEYLVIYQFVLARREEIFDYISQDNSVVDCIITMFYYAGLTTENRLCREEFYDTIHEFVKLYKKLLNASQITEITSTIGRYGI